MTAKATTSATWEQDVLQAEGPVLVDFWAAWCGPCRMAAPEVEKTARSMSGRAVVLKVDTDRHPGLADPLPIGHPYVFQNDTEFCAGYFEMFFRNPHHLAAHNPDLHAAYAALFGYDPRRCWPQDFPFYIEQNQAFYRSGQRPWPAGITVEAE